MRRKRELKLLRKKRLLKRYSDFELSLLASEMSDYTYLLKSIKFPNEELAITQQSKENEREEKEQESWTKNIEDSKVKYKKFFSFGDNGNNFNEKNAKEESGNEEEYEGLKPNDDINFNKKKRK